MENMLPKDYNVDVSFTTFIHQDMNNLLWFGGEGRLHALK